MPRPRKKPTAFEEYVPLPQAAQKYRVSAELLTRLAQDGKIRAVKVNGDFAVGKVDLQMVAKKTNVEEALRKKYADLEGHSIRLNAAVSKYKLNRSSLWRWANEGRIRILTKGKWELRLDESDVAVIRDLSK